MFRFIHAADIHLDSPLRGLSVYESAPIDSIRNACRKAFIKLVDLAIDEEVAFVLLAGDLYDGDWKDYSTGIFLSQQIGRLGQHNIQVFAVAGNHDAANKLTKALTIPANMKILSERSPETIVIDDLSVAIHGQSFATQNVTENLAANFVNAEPGMFNIGLLHTSLNGREGHAPYAPCSVDDLRSKGYQYWALGHVHKQEFVSDDPYIVFPGCIQGRHIRECGNKGCVLVTVEDQSVSSAIPHTLDVFRWLSCSIDLTDTNDDTELLDLIRDSIQIELDKAADLPAAMRIKFHGASKLAGQIAGKPEQLEKDIKSIGAELAGDGLWIERILNATVPKTDPGTILPDDNVFSSLLSDIINTPDDIEGLNDVIAGLRQKMPPEAFDPEASIKEIIKEAKDMLVGRLMTGGTSK